MTNCIFCKIIAAEIPCSKVYENEHVLAFLDLNPVNIGHSLIIPKKHATTILDFKAEEASPIFEAIQLVGASLIKAFNYKGFNCLQNNFEAAGQEVHHIHWHVIPRSKKDELFYPWPAGKYDSFDQMSDVANKLQHSLREVGCK